MRTILARPVVMLLDAIDSPSEFMQQFSDILYGIFFRLTIALAAAFRVADFDSDRLAITCAVSTVSCVPSIAVKWNRLNDVFIVHCDMIGYCVIIAFHVRYFILGKIGRASCRERV